MSSDLTDAELLLLGLVAEMPRHGYELEQVIARRGMREWTTIAFSSIYFVLGKLEKLGLVTGGKPKGAKARKIFTLTDLGREALERSTLAALSNVQPAHASLLLGMVHWPFLSRAEALGALASRQDAIGKQVQRIEEVRIARQPLPDHIDVLFDYTIGQLEAEAAWVGRTLDYMRTKPWLE